jgi:hypothetical protein
MKCPIILLVMMRSPRFKISDTSVLLYPSRVADWSGTLWAPEADRWWTSEPDCWSGKYVPGPRVILAMALPRWYWPWQCRVDVGRDMTLLLSLASNGAAEMTLTMAQRHCRSNLMKALPEVTSVKHTACRIAVTVCSTDWHWAAC